MKFAQLEKLAEVIISSDTDTIRKATVDLIANESGDWKKWGERFINFLDTGKLSNSVYAIDGNSKLPFVAFSVLPKVTCPGAGECLKFCYSFRAWRYPAAFFRQAQNTILVMYRREVLRDELSAVLAMPKFRKQDKVDFRLYVDGDIDSSETLEFWFDVLNEFPKLEAYGYSKSLELFNAYNGVWPQNYKLNLSSGSKYDDDDSVLDAAEALPITRGRFDAVMITGKFSAAKGEYRSKEYRSTVREAAGGKPFICPGRCGDCTPNGHACGSAKFNNIRIVIGIH